MPQTEGEVLKMPSNGLEVQLAETGVLRRNWARHLPAVTKQIQRRRNG
jgi:hypothetical protein